MCGAARTHIRLFIIYIYIPTALLALTVHNNRSQRTEAQITYIAWVWWCWTVRYRHKSETINRSSWCWTYALRLLCCVTKTFGRNIFKFWFWVQFGASYCCCHCKRACTLLVWCVQFWVYGNCSTNSNIKVIRLCVVFTDDKKKNVFSYNCIVPYGRIRNLGTCDLWHSRIVYVNFSCTHIKWFVP